MKTKKLEKAILEVIESYNLTFEDMEVEQIELILNSEPVRSFLEFSYSCLSSTGNYWNQIEYYSRNLGKNIVWDCDAEGYFESVDELVEFIEQTNKEIIEFERLLPNLSECGYIN